MADFPGDIVELEETFTYELGLLEYLALRGHSSGLLFLACSLICWR